MWPQQAPNLDSVAARRKRLCRLGRRRNPGEDDLMKDLISNENLRRIRFRVYDAGDFAEPPVSPSAANLLYDSVTGLAAHGGAARGIGRSALGADLHDLNMVVVRDFGGRRW
ncbi:hypothetical protein ACTMU2_21495 [Cupriavidus basilensis]